MASIVLAVAGRAVGSAAGGPLGATIGMQLGRGIGGFIDRGGKTRLRDVNGPRLTELSVQTSTYGKMIPVMYGMVRVAGNIIWARPIKEVVTSTTTTSSGGGGKGGGGGKVSQTSNDYSYYASLAVAICEGPVDGVVRIWADAKLLELGQYTIRLYKGDESQLPDSLIASYEGMDTTSAHRGMAYAVFEDFPLAEFGNRIPNFTFEVKKKAQTAEYNGDILENIIYGMTMIPGAGEFVYDTQIQYKVPGLQVGTDWVQQGSQERINFHNVQGRANALVALDQLMETCPNVGWVSVVVSWFGDNMDAGACIVKPGVEYQIGATTTPDSWAAGGFNRNTARLIIQVDGGPQYGGTPDDDSVLRYLGELRSRGYKIMFYPMLFMDVAGKNWRGELTGSASNVANFFTKTNGYNNFVTYYANLVGPYVDAFIIGSELKGLTKVTDTLGNYPAVNALVSLAGSVKSLLPGGVKVTYAADWSEYHHTDNGWYNMDPLWASSNIDVIGIDAYFPLTDAPQGKYDIDAAKAGWTSGEHFDWYYTDPARTTKASLSAAYALKNIDWFWNNTHINPGGAATGWIPQSKKIWFTEVGFPSVDGATNQPNVFYDPTSSNSAFPYFSKGRVDLRAQRTGLMATEQQWKGSAMVERMFIWTWDARPYPQWPDLRNVWSDGAAWKTGHWVQGKLGTSMLSAIVKDLAQRVGVASTNIDVSQIVEPVEGYIITAQQSVRQCVQELQLGYLFDVVESDHILKCIPRGNVPMAIIAYDEIAPKLLEGKAGEVLSITRVQEIELPKRVNVVYLNRLLDYQPMAQAAQREVTSSRDVLTLDLPIVFSDQAAKVLADVVLFTRWVERNEFSFDLSVKYAQLEPSDVITVMANGVNYTMRIISTRAGSPGRIRLQAVAEDVSAYDFYTAPGEVARNTSDIRDLAETSLQILDLPAIPGDDVNKPLLRFAGVGLANGWQGAVVYQSNDNGANYVQVASLPSAAAMGTATTILPDGPTNVFDLANNVTVIISGNAELASQNELAVLSGANAAVVGNEVVQFKTATLIEPGKYVLSNLLRGRLGTEAAMGGHVAGERFVLIDNRLSQQLLADNAIGLTRKYKPISVGGTLTGTTAQDFTYSALALRPLSPVRIIGARDGSGNLTITWLRRTRGGGDWKDYVDIPLNETAEAYEVEILNGGTVVRTISGLATPVATYSAANQVTDFGAAQGSVNMRVYQLSSVVGRGKAGVGVV